MQGVRHAAMMLKAAALRAGRSASIADLCGAVGASREEITAAVLHDAAAGLFDEADRLEADGADGDRDRLVALLRAWLASDPWPGLRQETERALLGSEGTP